jgi:hypothetical protein
MIAVRGGVIPAGFPKRPLMGGIASVPSDFYWHFILTSGPSSEELARVWFQQAFS